MEANRVKTLSRRISGALAAGVIVLVLAPRVDAEEEKLTMVFPAPVGVYKELRAETIRTQTLILENPGNLEVKGSLSVGPNFVAGAPGETFIEEALAIGANAFPAANTILHVQTPDDEIKSVLMTPGADIDGISANNEIRLGVNAQPPLDWAFQVGLGEGLLRNWTFAADLLPLGGANLVHLGTGLLEGNNPSVLRASVHITQDTVNNTYSLRLQSYQDSNGNPIPIEFIPASSSGFWLDGATGQMNLGYGPFNAFVTNPGAKLHVRDDSGIQVDAGVLTGNGDQGLRILEDRIQASGGNLNQRLLVLAKGTGNVGIGTVSSFLGEPTAMLHVEQDGAADALRVDDTNADPTPFVIDQDGNVSVGGTLTMGGTTASRAVPVFTDFQWTGPPPNTDIGVHDVCMSAGWTLPAAAGLGPRNCRVFYNAGTSTWWIQSTPGGIGGMVCYARCLDWN